MSRNEYERPRANACWPARREARDSAGVDTSRETLTPAIARRMLGVSATGLRKLDRELAPTRDPHGYRVYSAARVAELAAERAQRRSAAR